MPATIPTRPSGGAVVATDWGQDVHDRVYGAKGITANGNALVLAASTITTLDVRATNFGNPAFLAGDNVSLRIPAGFSGIYMVEAFATITSFAAGNVGQLRVLRNGGSTFGNSFPALGAISTFASVSGILACSDGDLVTVQGWANIASTSWSVSRLSIWRVSNVIATS